MAEEDRPRFNPQDRNRDGIDDDVDRRPGNSDVSASLAARSDPRSEQEFSNLLLPQDLIQRRANEQRYQEISAARNAMQAAQQDVHFFPDVGKFIIPAENTWAAHAELVHNNDMRLHFNPDKYFFDRIIAEKLNIPALVDRKHPDFDKWRGLRTNLEVLRNDIIGQYLDDGGFDKEDVVYIEPIKGIATVIAESLANDVWWKRPFTSHFSLDVANVEAVGAAEMYKFLLRQQDGKGLSFFQSIVDGLRSLLGLPDRNWGLLPLEKTPFSPAGLSAPPPAIEKIAAPQPQAEYTPAMAEHRALEALSLASIAAHQDATVDRLSAEDKKISVEDGHTILRWLRNLQGQDVDVQEFLSTGTTAEREAKADALGKLVKLYTHQMQTHRNLHTERAVKDGSDAAGGAAMMVAEFALSMLPESAPSHALLASAVDAMPEAHFERSHQSIGQLLDLMDAGLSQLSGTPQTRSVTDRLIQATQNLGKKARELRSVDTLAAPKREESVELGREILRKLRGMSFSDKPMAELVENAPSEEKVALAERIEEMVEIYRNLLADALSANPGLADDARVKAANDAVGGMTHGIKLMASKDIPSSIAQAQQISADVTQDPKEWGEMSKRAMDRLLETMEGGLQAAVESMEQQQQEQQQDEELAQEAIAAAMHTDNARRKRRRRRQSKSGLSAKASEKKLRDIMADDRAAGQGRFAQEANKDEKAAPYAGLSAKDMAAIKALGGTLQGANREAKSLPVADVSLSAPVSPDDKSAADRAIESALQARRNNRRTT